MLVELSVIVNHEQLTKLGFPLPGPELCGRGQACAGFRQVSPNPVFTLRPCLLGHITIADFRHYLVDALLLGAVRAGLMDAFGLFQPAPTLDTAVHVLK